ncbi:MAG: NIPSNAP family protein [Rhodobiaceae bacterium]|nr:NIPSNAP family protein [Rhodobiaceae bacterium]
MIYDLRVYEHADGKGEAVTERFLKEVVKRFPDHGIELVGVFTDRETGRLTYLTRYENEDARLKAWDSFVNDPDWKAVKAASEPDGPLVAKSHTSVLLPLLDGLPNS